MTRLLVFLVLAAAAASYPLWVYRRLELPVRGKRAMAILRAVALVVVLALLFDPHLPAAATPGTGARWVVLDNSLSMGAGTGGGTAWSAASARAAELEDAGWTLVELAGPRDSTVGGPEAGRTLLTPVLERAAEFGARDVVVLSDMRVEDATGVRGALEELPVGVSFEAFGVGLRNAGVAALRVPDAPRPGETVTAQVEIHGEGNDSATVEVFADGAPAGSRRVAIPSPGLRATIDVPVEVPAEGGRIRYTARVSATADDFASDDEAVDYASVGYEEGALVLLSLEPGWEPRFLLPVMEEVTGLPAVGYMRVGADRFVPMGRALERTPPVDSATVGRAVRDAELVVIHGIASAPTSWERALLRRPGRTVLFPRTAETAGLLGVRTVAPRPGEWYASADLPPSPLSGDLAGAQLLGLPPLTDVFLPFQPFEPVSPLDVQLRGAGAAQPALHLEDADDGRRVIVLASGFWRWAMREGAGRDAYRRLWSGVAGWLLADEDVQAPEPRPVQWVFARGQAVRFSIPGRDDAFGLLLESAADGGVVRDTTLASGSATVGVLPPGEYRYRFTSDEGEEVAAGRLDVAATTTELAPAPASFEDVDPAVRAAAVAGGGRPLRTSPWPYLLVIVLLCGEWIVRRRSGLR